MPSFLLKTEPNEYAYADLVREGRTTWTGVANPQALAVLRTMRKSDQAFIYHTAGEKAIVGLAKAVSDPHEDPKQPGKTDKGEPKHAVIDLAPLRVVKVPVTLAAIKSDPRFASFALVKQSRLSVMSVPQELDKLLRAMAGL